MSAIGVQPHWKLSEEFHEMYPRIVPQDPGNLGHLSIGIYLLLVEGFPWEC